MSIGVGLAVGVTINSYADSINFCGDDLYKTDDLERCTAKNLKYEDDKLNSSYRKLRGILNSREKNLLKKAQLDWIKFRDSACEFGASTHFGGREYNMIYADCLAQYTYERRMQLDSDWSYRQQ